MQRSGILLPLVVTIGVLSRARSQKALEYTIEEEKPGGTLVGNIPVDAELDGRYDAATLSRLTYTFLRRGSRRRNLFALSEETGILRTASRIDRDKICPNMETCVVPLDIAIQPVDYFQIIKVKVYITDINDNWPKFPKKQMPLDILESTMPGAKYLLPAATDPDVGLHTIQGYQLLSDTGAFELRTPGPDARNLHLVVREKLDREKVPKYQLEILSYDGGRPQKSGTLVVDIGILDTNDNNPRFLNSTYSTSVAESAPIDTTILQVKAVDADIGLNGQLFYTFEKNTAEKYDKIFGISNMTGDIYVKGLLDREDQSSYDLMVEARDRGADPVPDVAKVTIIITDVNDHPPNITVNALKSTGLTEISENADPGSFVAHISIEDPDKGRNGEVKCKLQDDHFQLRQLYATEFKMVTKTKFDREKKAQYNVVIRCHDLGNPPKKATRRIKVTVSDENDHVPVFSKELYTASIKENNKDGAYVLQVNTTDQDIGLNQAVRYKIKETEGFSLKIDPHTGVVTASRPFDYEVMKEVQAIIIASDRGYPSLSTTSSLVLTILDDNDEPPIFSQTEYEFGIFENQPSHSEVGHVVASDFDSPPHNKFSFSFIHQYNPKSASTFSIHPETGLITTRRPLDRELQAVYHLMVAATDNEVPSLSTNATVTIFVADHNDNSPIIDFPSSYNNTVYISSLAPKGYRVGKVEATDKDLGENAELTFKIMGNDDMFKIDSGSGIITVNTELRDFDQQMFQLVIKVEDQGSSQKTAVSGLNVVVNRSVAINATGVLKVSGYNLTIVVSLAGALGFVMLVLICAIIFLRKQSRDRHMERVNYTDDNILNVTLEKLENRGQYWSLPSQEDDTLEKDKRLHEGTDSDADPSAGFCQSPYNVSLHVHPPGLADHQQSARGHSNLIFNGAMATMDCRTGGSQPTTPHRTGATNRAQSLGSLHRQRIVYNPMYAWHREDWIDREEHIYKFQDNSQASRQDSDGSTADLDAFNRLYSQYESGYSSNPTQHTTDNTPNSPGGPYLRQSSESRARIARDNFRRSHSYSGEQTTPSAVSREHLSEDKEEDEHSIRAMAEDSPPPSRVALVHPQPAKRTRTRKRSNRDSLDGTASLRSRKDPVGGSYGNADSQSASASPRFDSVEWTHARHSRSFDDNRSAEDIAFHSYNASAMRTEQKPTPSKRHGRRLRRQQKERESGVETDPSDIECISTGISNKSPIMRNKVIPDNRKRNFIPDASDEGTASSGSYVGDSESSPENDHNNRMFNRDMLV